MAASESRLQGLQIHSLKVDRSSIISTMHDHGDSQEIVKLIVAMAHTLNLRVVAEGTETEAQVRIPKRLNREMAQGYFFSRPGPVDTNNGSSEKSTCKPRLFRSWSPTGIGSFLAPRSGEYVIPLSGKPEPWVQASPARSSGKASLVISSSDRAARTGSETLRGLYYLTSKCQTGGRRLPALREA